MEYIDKIQVVQCQDIPLLYRWTSVIGNLVKKLKLNTKLSYVWITDYYYDYRNPEGPRGWKISVTHQGHLRDKSQMCHCT